MLNRIDNIPNQCEYNTQELLEKGYHFINGEPMKPFTVEFIKGIDEEIDFSSDSSEKITMEIKK